jgi:superoxide dismutase, Fe-Mn family
MDTKKPITPSKIETHLNRRTLLKVAGGLTIAAGAAHLQGIEPQVEATATKSTNASGFELPPLPYAYDALEPYIDTQTMHLHHDKHHQAYVNNLNAALQDHPFAHLSIEEVMRRLNELPEPLRTAVRNNGGGHLNHTLFWQLMIPGGSTQPIGALAKSINRTFGSFDAFKTAFNDAGSKHFGSGWVWLILNRHGNLQIVSTPNQDNPLTEGAHPIMGNDLWEHAYYLKYHNRRPEYLQAWWNILNWDQATKRYTHARRL